MIRDISREEIPECARVIRESFMTVADEFGITPENGGHFTAFATTPERLIYHLESEKRVMRAYFDGDRIAGYYSLLMQDGGECELGNLCVLPEYRHRDIGSRLLDDAAAKAKENGRTKINIGIVEENKMLRDWYESKGFVHIGTKKFDFFPFTCGYMEKKI